MSKIDQSKNLASFFLPILGTIYPVIFLYSHNAKIMKISSVTMPLFAAILLALVVYGLFWIAFRRAHAAGLSALVFVLFVSTYGIVFDKLLQWDVLPVEHYQLLPAFLFCAVFAALLIRKINIRALQQTNSVLVMILLGLNLFNIIAAVPAEIQKAQVVAAKQIAPAAVQGGENLPDIYYILLDEYAGFDALRQYWKYDGYQDFAAFLDKKGFFVAEHSRSNTYYTLYEVASRLNLKVYERGTEETFLFKEISDNLVMRELKARGYTTVVFDGAATGYPTKTEVIADYNIMYDPKESQSQGLSVDDYAIMLLDQTMFRVLQNTYKANDSTADIYRGMVLLTLSEITELDYISSPKFVYAHLLSPHPPFIFDEFGLPGDFRNKYNWYYYLDQHKFITRQMQTVLEKILAQSDPANPPIIVLQSDHGARNHVSADPYGVNLPNYSKELEYMILNALYLPGYDTSQLSDDLNPLYTFEIILNHYFQAGVTVEE